MQRGMGLRGFVQGCQGLVGGAKSALQMQYKLSGNLELDATICVDGTGGGQEDTWTLAAGSCTGDPPPLPMGRVLCYDWPAGRRLQRACVLQARHGLGGVHMPRWGGSHQAEEVHCIHTHI